MSHAAHVFRLHEHVGHDDERGTEPFSKESLKNAEGGGFPTSMQEDTCLGEKAAEAARQVAGQRAGPQAAAVASLGVWVHAVGDTGQPALNRDAAHYQDTYVT